MQEYNFDALSKPSLYTKTQGKFWNDEYISAQMLKAHLDAESDGASRKLSFIEKSVKWIGEICPSASFGELLDVGCGPGIYAERFDKLGYTVCGIDFSARSIDYAKQSAEKRNLNIKYVYLNYLTMDFNEKFDLATMIYCDYGALSTEDRKLLLSKIYASLKKGGRLLLDVFSMKRFNDFKESQTWSLCKKDGFWRADEHLTLMGGYKYGGNVTLDTYVVVSQKGVQNYYLWDTYFTAESLSKEMEKAGFCVLNVFGDVCGSKTDEQSDTLAILVEKS